VRRAQRGVINVKSIPRHLTPVMSNPYRSTQNFHSGYTTTIRRVYFKLFTLNLYHSYIYIYRYRSASVRVGAIMRNGGGIYVIYTYIFSERNAEKSVAKRINRMMDCKIFEQLFFLSFSFRFSFFPTTSPLIARSDMFFKSHIALSPQNIITNKIRTL
jgi:hypothetical protein